MSEPRDDFETTKDEARGEPSGAELRDDFEATKDEIRADTERLRRLEAQKADLDPSDPEAGRLAQEIEQLARRLADRTAVERELTEKAREEPGS
ncbi:MAG TPA: hypothetical protein VNJ28_06195 [Candidatus Limnocylindrales bacterium]|nr:hypothetical protein [Candidatus Limnocylindrales bacterium]